MENFFKMDQIIFKEIENDIETWKEYFKKYPIEQIKIIKKIGDKIWITKPTGFLLVNTKCYVLGYTTETNVLYDTNKLNPHALTPYSSNKYYITRREFHEALYWRIELLESMQIHISDLKWYEIGRRCLFIIYMDLEMNILYQRELKLLRKMKQYNKDLYDKLVKGDFYKRMYDLYHNYTYYKNTFNYTDHVMAVTYKWKKTT